ncbi:MAG: tetratricopeptide repeat protein [Candidatus Symbiothrix sp.]|jgi:TolA-binding protein|nr:tetratricopeptide repeat protein [Candidatus Symbiothrix sp.]
MKRIVLSIVLAALLHTVSAQRTSQYIAGDRLFRESVTMYNDQNYAGCIDKLTAYKQQYQVGNAQETDFLLAACSYHLGREDAGTVLREYLDHYPETPHRNEIAFFLGSVYFKEKNYPMSKYWLRQSDIDFLSEDEQADYAYRMANIALQYDKDDQEATQLFTALSINSSKYRTSAQYYLAYLAYKEQNYDRALSLFSALKSDVQYSEEAQYYLTQIYFAKQQYAQVIRDGQALVKEYPRNELNPEINRMIGVSYYQLNDYVHAIQYLQPLADTQSTLLQGKDYYTLGVSYFQTKNYKQAIDALSKSQPANDALGQSAYIYLGQSYLAEKENDLALRAFESASRMDFDTSAKEASSYNYAMLLHQNSGDHFGESVSVLENFVNTYPQSVYADKVNDALVETYLTTNNYQTALASIQKIKQPNKKILEAKQEVLYHLGVLDFTNGNFSEAINELTQAVAVGNYAPEARQKALFWRGEAYYRIADYTQATQDFQSFVNSGSTDKSLQATSAYNLGYCAFKQKNYVQAKTSFQSFVQQGSDDKTMLADAYVRIGDCCYYQRQFQEAQTAYEQAINAAPATADYAMYQKAYLLGLQKKYQEKANQMDALIKTFPNSPYLPDALYEKGRALVLLNNIPSAIACYQQLTEQYPNSASARSAGLQTGLLYYNANQPQQAIAAYKNVVAKYPNSDEAKEALRDLKQIYFDRNEVNVYADYVKTLNGAVKFEVSEQDSLTYLAAERLFQQKETATAQKALTRYLTDFPQGAFRLNVHYYLANIYYDQKNYTAAKQEYAQVLAAGDTRFLEEAVGRTAEIQYNEKDYQAALESYSRMQQLASGKINYEAGALGVIRSANQLENHSRIIQAANDLLKDSLLKQETATEARYYRAKALWATNDRSQALSDLKILAADTRTAYGAEAKYLLAQAAYDAKNYAEVRTIVQDFSKKGSPHHYWLAKSLITLSDAYSAEGDKLLARQYLESLQNNYKPTDDDIQSIIRERLAKL